MNRIFFRYSAASALVLGLGSPIFLQGCGDDVLGGCDPDLGAKITALALAVVVTHPSNPVEVGGAWVARDHALDEATANERRHIGMFEDIVDHGIKILTGRLPSWLRTNWRAGGDGGDL